MFVLESGLFDDFDLVSDDFSREIELLPFGPDKELAISSRLGLSLGFSNSSRVMTPGFMEASIES